MRILYIGPNKEWTTSRHRADALRRLKHDVKVVDPYDFLPKHSLILRLMQLWGRCLGYRWIAAYTSSRMLSNESIHNYDCFWVNQHMLLNQNFVRKWTQQIPSIMYINDNPFSGEVESRWSVLLKALPFYSVVAVVRDEDVSVARNLGCKNVERIWMSYDPVVHKRLPFSEEDKKSWESDVLFVGSYMPERGPFLAHLVDAGVPLKIYGSNWHKAKEWPQLKKHWVSGWISGKDYVLAVQYAKIVLGLLSEGNKDFHTQRSMEVPYIGSLFCCKRTHEHQALYEEGKEAVMWSSAEECAELCMELLADPDRIEMIASNGSARVIRNIVSNDDVTKSLIHKLEIFSN